jgi:hypothetical protein
MATLGRKPTTTRKAEMLTDADKSSRKAYGYAIDARLAKASEKAAKEIGYPANRYKADKDAANAMANMHESEAEVMRQRASAKPKDESARHYKGMANSTKQK